MRAYMHACMCVCMCVRVYVFVSYEKGFTHVDKRIELDSNLSATHQSEQWHKIDSQGKHPISNETYHDLPSEL